MRQLFLVPLTAFTVCGSALAQSAVKLPDGEGSEVTKRVCTECHGLETVVAERHTKPQWQTLVETMVDRGASATDAEVKTIVDYLAKNFAPKDSDGK